MPKPPTANTLNFLNLTKDTEHPLEHDLNLLVNTSYRVLQDRAVPSFEKSHPLSRTRNRVDLRAEFKYGSFDEEVSPVHTNFTEHRNRQTVAVQEMYACLARLSARLQASTDQTEYCPSESVPYDRQDQGDPQDVCGDRRSSAVITGRYLANEATLYVCPDTPTSTVYDDDLPPLLKGYGCWTRARMVIERALEQHVILRATKKRRESPYWLAKLEAVLMRSQHTPHDCAGLLVP